MEHYSDDIIKQEIDDGGEGDDRPLTSNESQMLDLEDIYSGGGDQDEESFEEIGKDDSTEPTGVNRKRKLLKKAPDAPKRFKSAYICFVTEKMNDVKKSLATDTKVTEVMKVLACMWRNLPPLDKLKYERIADADKSRYFEELSHYTGPMQVPNKRQKKPPGAPKRAMSAFLSFSQLMRPTIRAQYPDLKNTDISGVLAEKWRQATEEEKRPHIDRELKEREKYHGDMARWKEEELVRQKEEIENRRATTRNVDEVNDKLYGNTYEESAYESRMHSQHPMSGEERQPQQQHHEEEQDSHLKTEESATYHFWDRSINDESDNNNLVSSSNSSHGNNTSKNSSSSSSVRSNGSGKKHSRSSSNHISNDVNKDESQQRKDKDKKMNKSTKGNSNNSNNNNNNNSSNINQNAASKKNSSGSQEQSEDRLPDDNNCNNNNFSNQQQYNPGSTKNTSSNTNNNNSNNNNNNNNNVPRYFYPMAYGWAPMTNGNPHGIPTHMGKFYSVQYPFSERPEGQVAMGPFPHGYSFQQMQPPMHFNPHPYLEQPMHSQQQQQQLPHNGIPSQYIQLARNGFPMSMSMPMTGQQHGHKVTSTGTFDQYPFSLGPLYDTHSSNNNNSNNHNNQACSNSNNNAFSHPNLRSASNDSACYNNNNNSNNNFSFDNFVNIAHQSNSNLNRSENNNGTNNHQQEKQPEQVDEERGYQRHQQQHNNNTTNPSEHSKHTDANNSATVMDKANTSNSYRNVTETLWAVQRAGYDC